MSAIDARGPSFVGRKAQSSDEKTGVLEHGVSSSLLCSIAFTAKQYREIHTQNAR